MKNQDLLKRLFSYFVRYKNIMIFDLFCASLTILCEITFPLLVRYITDLANNNLEKLTVGIIFTIGGIYLSLRIIEAAANYFMQSAGHNMGAKIETDMRSDLFSHLTDMSFGYYSNAKIGSLMSRLTNDLFDITEFAHHYPEEMFIAFLKITVSFSILASFNLYLTLIIFAMLPLMLISVQFFNKKMRRAYKEQRKTLGEINAQAEDSLLGIRVVKSFANESLEREKFSKNNDKFLKAKKHGYTYMAGFHSVTRIFDGIMYIMVLVIGGIFLIKKKISLGDFTAYLLYVTTLLNSIRRIVEYKEQFNRGMTGIERFAEIMDTPPEITEGEKPKELIVRDGEVEMRNVKFSYIDGHTEVFKRLNLKIKSGERLAIVGSSGGGKTTLCNLIPRFYDVDDGEILIDGVNVKDVTLKSLRDNIGMVQQDVYLFSGTIAENIEYGKPGSSMEEIIESAKQSGAHEFISQLKDGYSTYVGERGVKLSGGQKQRISIARVFLKSPKILILDEATSALDNESEHIVKASLAKLSEGRTSVTIAHRLSTIKNADRIVVIDKGEIAEEGNHVELLQKQGIYYRLNQ